MRSIKVDFGKKSGKIKHINAVNNGPFGSRVRMTGNFKEYEALHIPYARLHDSAFYASNYGGEYSVDVHRVFPNFDADENDPKSYIFAPTDSYLKDILAVGTKIYYRLGAAIEHGYKRGTYPPKDYLKWARICEHIIRHYNEGWADGFNMGIEYFEIWNEFDCRNHDGSNPCWQGTDEQFFDFFCTVHKYLKGKFPSLKIGGPAFCNVKEPLIDDLLSALEKEGVKLDFFSYHWYGCTMQKLIKDIRFTNAALQRHGMGDIETHLNEWNYIKGWLADEFQYSLDTMANEKGASFVAAAMCVAQYEKLDMLMYYDARPCNFNGIFNKSGKPLKSYYTFMAADMLKNLGESTETVCDSDLYAIGASNGNESAVFTTFFSDDDQIGEDIIKVSFSSALKKNVLRAEVYLLNKDHDLELIKEEYFTSENSSILLKAKNYDTYLIKFINE